MLELYIHQNLVIWEEIFDAIYNFVQGKHKTLLPLPPPKKESATSLGHNRYEGAGGPGGGQNILL